MMSNPSNPITTAKKIELDIRISSFSMSGYKMIAASNPLIKSTIGYTE